MCGGTSARLCRGRERGWGCEREREEGRGSEGECEARVRAGGMSGGSETGDPEYCGRGRGRKGKGKGTWEAVILLGVPCVRARESGTTVRVLLYILLNNNNIVFLYTLLRCTSREEDLPPVLR